MSTHCEGTASAGGEESHLSPCGHSAGIPGHLPTRSRPGGIAWVLPGTARPGKAGGSPGRRSHPPEGRSAGQFSEALSCGTSHAELRAVSSRRETFL